MNNNWSTILLVGVSSLWCLPAAGESQLPGLITDSVVVRYEMTSAEYQQALDTYRAAGYRLTSVDGYKAGDTPHFAAIWQPAGRVPWAECHDKTAAEYQRLFDHYVHQLGYQLTHVDAYQGRTGPRFAAIWAAVSVPAWKSYHDLSEADFDAINAKLGRRGYRLHRISGYQDSVQGTLVAKYAVIWRRTATPTRHVKAVDARAFKWQNEVNSSRGYQLHYINAFNSLEGRPVFAAIWKVKDGRFGVHTRLNLENLQNTLENAYYQGNKVNHITAYRDVSEEMWTILVEEMLDPAAAQLIEEKVKDFMCRWCVPALSIAIVMDERLVFAKAWGHKDLAKIFVASPLHKFRIASVSKPITATAVMKLVSENEARDLNDTIFTSGVFGTAYGTLDSPSDQITIGHLLEHVAGGWPRGNNDPMIEDVSWDHADLITYVFSTSLPVGTIGSAHWWLQDPNSHYVYSNFGYCLLGRVIEHWSGDAYEDWVQDQILAPAVGEPMRVACSLYCGLLLPDICLNVPCPNVPWPDEVSYEKMYWRNLRRMDSHGGWVASSVDLARFLVSVDGKPKKPDVLDATTRQQMLTSDEVDTLDTTYAKGWHLRCPLAAEACHGGRIDPADARAGIVLNAKIENSLFSYAIVANKSEEDDEDYHNDFANLVPDLLETIDVNAWPAYDLFTGY